MSGKSQRCLVLGVNGQDGSYIANHLLVRKCLVWGVGRQPTSKWVGPNKRFTYNSLDLTNIADLTALMRAIDPHRIFHFAAIHGAAGYEYEEHWYEAHLVNTLATHAILEHIRRSNKEGVLIYASSSKAFGHAPPTHTSELCVRKSQCIYSITKNAATDLIQYYRSRHGVLASVVWLFNHESPRRASSYFIPHIVNILANSILDSNHQGSIDSLSFWGDWGDANEYMRLVVDIAEKAPGNDFILASGATLWARQFVERLFLRYGLDAANHVIPRATSPKTKPKRWRADISRLSQMLGSTPRVRIQDVCDEILRLNHPTSWAARALAV